MNYAQLQQAILDDTHKGQYAGADVQRYIAMGEALISAHLESYNFLKTLTDTDRVSANSSNYNLPSGLTQLRYVKINGQPLDKVDESNIFLYNTASNPVMYAQRDTQIIIAGTPAAGVGVDIDYMGMPDPLATTPTNTLLTKYPQLYIDAAAVYIFRRAQDYDSGDIAMQSLVGLCARLNSQVKKKLGGAQSSRNYNTDFRSSY